MKKFVSFLNSRRQILCKATASIALSMTASFNHAAPVELSANEIGVDRNAWVNFQVNLPERANDIAVEINNGTGDADLYVRFNARPSQTIWDCRPYVTGNNERCTFDEAESSSMYISLYGYSAASGITISVRYDDGLQDDDEESASDYIWSGVAQYYGDIENLSGTSLKRSLAESAMIGHQRMSYSQVWDALRYTDEDPNNRENVKLLYSGRSQSKNFTSSGNNDPDAWNREHSWPKSRGFPKQSQWAYTDIHHLRPTDASVNSTRSNKDYGSANSELTEAPGNFTSSDFFEPRDAVKGDVARMMFYMAVRYEGADSSQTPDLELTTQAQGSGAELGNLCLLLEWSKNDPVSAEEIERHRRIVERQGNRNPFIDNARWASLIWRSRCD